MKAFAVIKEQPIHVKKVAVKFQQAPQDVFTVSAASQPPPTISKPHLIDMRKKNRHSIEELTIGKFSRIQQTQINVFNPQGNNLINSQIKSIPRRVIFKKQQKENKIQDNKSDKSKSISVKSILINQSSEQNDQEPQLIFKSKNSNNLKMFRTPQNTRNKIDSLIYNEATKQISQKQQPPRDLYQSLLYNQVNKVFPQHKNQPFPKIQQSDIHQQLRNNEKRQRQKSYNKIESVLYKEAQNKQSHKNVCESVIYNEIKKDIPNEQQLKSSIKSLHGSRPRINSQGLDNSQRNNRRTHIFNKTVKKSQQNKYLDPHEQTTSRKKRIFTSHKLSSSNIISQKDQIQQSYSCQLNSKINQNAWTPQIKKVHHLHHKKYKDLNGINTAKSMDISHISQSSLSIEVLTINQLPPFII